MELIVAVDRNWAIGRGTDMLISISADLKRFRELTMGKILIYGRKTMASFPSGRPLAKRRNIVLSRTMDRGEDYELCTDYEELAHILEQEDTDDLVLIGGASLYTALESFCSHAEITYIEHAFDGPEHFIPNFDRLDRWKLISESEPMLDEASGLTYRYRRYENLVVRPLADLAKL